MTEKAPIQAKIALGLYWCAIAVALGWTIFGEFFGPTGLLFVTLLGVFAAVLPLEQHATRLRLAAVSRLATVDELTGLHNRRFFMSRLLQELSRKRHHALSVAVLILDLDRFKTVN